LPLWTDGSLTISNLTIEFPLCEAIHIPIGWLRTFERLQSRVFGNFPPGWGRDGNLPIIPSRELRYGTCDGPFFRVGTTWRILCKMRYAAGMSQDVLSVARGQAEQSNPPVKAAALMRIARVLTALDQAEADRVLERGIQLATELPEPDRSTILNGAVSLAAMVSPRRALGLVSSLGTLPHERNERTDRLIFGMLTHRHIAEAVSHFCEPLPGEGYPFRAAHNTLRCSGEEEACRKILRAAVAAWLGNSDSLNGPTPARFVTLFSSWWKVLPEEEAVEAAREIVRHIVSEPDQTMNARISNGSQTLELSSRRESALLRILGPLRRLDSELASSLCQQYPQLGHALSTNLFGEGGMPLEPPADGPRYITVGGSGVASPISIPILEALETDFKVAFEEASRLYALDTAFDNRNEAPREYWPSTNEFRKILYEAGKYDGAVAARHLDRIPDRDLRLFARIELAAAIAGLAQGVLTSISSRPHRS
jgi:hypothetical protein